MMALNESVIIFFSEVIFKCCVMFYVKSADMNKVTCSACFCCSGYAEKTSKDERATQLPLVGHLTTEAAKRTVVLRGIVVGTERQDVEKLVGNLNRVRQLRYPVVVGGSCGDCCAAVVYRGTRDALRAVQRLQSRTIAGLLTICSRFSSVLKFICK